jgi:hypothetical protein
MTTGERAILENVRIIVEMQKLASAGKHESPEADELRDRGARLWPYLDAEVQEAIRKLSADLYAIAGARP